VQEIADHNTLMGNVDQVAAEKVRRASIDDAAVELGREPPADHDAVVLGAGEATKPPRFRDGDKPHCSIDNPEIWSGDVDEE
jgi:hypothetical protein